ncbi:MAG: ammonium transporter [Candidatus Geothermincolia bacterium]
MILPEADERERGGIEVKKPLLVAMLAILLLALMAPAAGAAATEAARTPESIATDLDTLWVLIAAALVFFMQAGFFLLEGGLTRAKNVSNAMMKGIMDFCLGALVYWLLGFAVMFGVSRGGVFGGSGFLSSIGRADWNGLPFYVFLIFQIAFAGAAATILAGGVAERFKFSAYCVATVAITGLIYPVVGHWIWAEGGWLYRIGMLDFAGSTVVHTTGGICALVGAWMVGPRIGKYRPDGKANAIPGHNIPMAALGTFILWLGWFGFNPGSTLKVSAAIGHIAMTTTLAAAAGATVTMFLTWRRYAKPDISMTLNGALAGLVAITAGCPYVSMASAAAIGAIGGVLVVFSVEFIDRRLKIDDPVGAVSVHAANGIWGTLAIGLFSQAGVGQANGVAAVDGLFFGGGFAQLGRQALGSLSTVVWVAAAAGLLFLILKKTIGLRVDDESQRIGLDLAEHGIQAYPEFQPVLSDD